MATRPSEIPRDQKGKGYTLKRRGLIRSLRIFDSRVCRGRPNFAAAPPGPETKPFVSRSAFSIIAFSRVARSAEKGRLAFEMGAVRVNQLASKIGRASCR